VGDPSTHPWLPQLDMQDGIYEGGLSALLAARPPRGLAGHAVPGLATRERSFAQRLTLNAPAPRPLPFPRSFTKMLEEGVIATREAQR
jgi:hypothetical protein